MSNPSYELVSNNAHVADDTPKPQPAAAPPKLPYSAYSDNRKKFLLAIVTAAAFLAPLAGNIYLPALPLLAEEFGVSDVAINTSVSVFMLVFAVAPLFWGAASDFIGRKPLYTISFLVFVFANVVLAAVPTNYGALLILRIVQAIGASSVASLGAGTVADLYAPSVRASAISIFMLGPQIGPVLGPMLGGGIIAETTWRWIFGFLAILGFVVWVWMLFGLPETLRGRVGNSAVNANTPWLDWPKFTQRVEIDEGTIIMKRPSAFEVFKILAYPPVTIASANVALLFGSYYCVAVTLPTVLLDTYDFSSGAIGASYAVPGLSMVAGSIASGRFADITRARAIKESPDGKVAPEVRLRSQIYGVIAFPIGIEMYGWFCRYEFHPAAVLFSTTIIGFSMSWVFATNMTYMTECKPGAAATVVALAGLFRNPAAAIASVVIDPVVDSAGMGWAFRALAAVDVTCIGLVMLLIIYGPRWRKRMLESTGKKGATKPSGTAILNTADLEKAQAAQAETTAEMEIRIAQIEHTMKNMVDKEDVSEIVLQHINDELRSTRPPSWGFDHRGGSGSPTTLSEAPLLVPGSSLGR